MELINILKHEGESSPPISPEVNTYLWLLENREVVHLGWWLPALHPQFLTVNVKDLVKRTRVTLIYHGIAVARRDSSFLILERFSQSTELKDYGGPLTAIRGYNSQRKGPCISPMNRGIR